MRGKLSKFLEIARDDVIDLVVLVLCAVCSALRQRRKEPSGDK